MSYGWKSLIQKSLDPFVLNVILRGVEPLHHCLIPVASAPSASLALHWLKPGLHTLPYPPDMSPEVAREVLVPDEACCHDFYVKFPGPSESACTARIDAMCMVKGHVLDVPRPGVVGWFHTRGGVYDGYL